MDRVAGVQSLTMGGLLIVSIASTACGSKTGLHIPDSAVDAGVDAGPPCLELPLDGGPIQLPLETEAQLGRADVVFLIDTTLSMKDEIDTVRDRLRDRLAPAVEAAIPDVAFAVATFEDFPVDPYGVPDVDQPFTLRLPISTNLASVQGAVNVIELGQGQDMEESHVEALFQLATGQGLGGWIPPSAGCPRGGIGYACLRADALPVVLLFTDAPFHNGPTGAAPYVGIIPEPHQYADAVAVLQPLGVRVIGFDSSGMGNARPDLAQLALDTRTVDTEGSPLVYEIGRDAAGLSNSVVGAIETFAGSVVFDIDVLVNDPNPSDGLDVTQFVDAVRPLYAVPMSAIQGIDQDRGVFEGVVAGTTVVFELTLRNDAVVPGTEPLRVEIEIIFRGDGRTWLGSRIVEVVIPAADGTGCESENDESM